MTGCPRREVRRGARSPGPGAPVPAERAVALPGLRGIPIAGVPADGSGFVHVDAVGRVKGLDDVYAAGDGTSFPGEAGRAGRADGGRRGVDDRGGGRRSVEPTPFDPFFAVSS